MNELIRQMLEKQSIDQDAIVQTDTGNRTPFEVLESAILGALEEIEEGMQ